MKNEINAVLENMTTTIPEPEDYTGEDGLLYCGKCRKPKEAYFAPDKAAIFGRDRHPAECDCQRTAREEREAAEKRRRHLDTVEELKRRGFTDPTMLIIQDQIWGRVTQNRSQGRATWYFADEFHLLLKEEQTAAYSAEIWKRFRKWGGVPTGATQNVKDLLSSPEIENILENSDFITLLNQASGDRKILSERLNLSADQQKYIDNSEPGEGLLIFENVVLPFSNPIPKNTQLYKIMTTRLSEVVEL